MDVKGGELIGAVAHHRHAFGLEDFQRARDIEDALGAGTNDGDGRARDLLSSAPEEGHYRLTFDTGAYFRAVGETGFYPQVSVIFVVGDGEEHCHVPLLLSPFGYSTYRGS